MPKAKDNTSVFRGQQMAEVDAIWVSQDRQRKSFRDIDGLAESIRIHGLINPIVVTESLNLIAGERRWRAFKELGLKSIPVRYFTDLSDWAKKAIELEENLRRADLTWIEQVLAVLEYHELMAAHHGDGWTYEASAESLGYNKAFVARHCQVANAIRANDEQILATGGITAACNMLSRRRERVVDTELSQVDIGSVMNAPSTPPTSPHTRVAPIAGGQAPAVPTTSVPSPQRPLIARENFLDWAKTYKGRPFNLLHCDFPYGINHDKSDQGGADRHGAYEDTPELYFDLVRALITHHKRILFPSAHVLFWFSMEHYAATVDLLETGGFTVNRFPLVWHKTDNRGILPDPARGPRRVYETALLLSRGDRKVIQAVGNTYGAPTAKVDGGHISTKPVPVLKHFFRMLVDDLTEILDPTCGSGTALIAAHALGAVRIQGFDIDPDYVELAQTNTQRAAVLQEYSGGDEGDA